LLQAIEKVSEEGEGFGAVRSKYADPERRFPDLDMTEAVEDIDSGAGIWE
jgi:hypothetical protein